MTLCDAAKEGTWAGKPARCQRVPWNKSHTGFGTNIDEPVGGSIAQIIVVLDGDDRGYGACSGKLPLGDVRYADIADLALPLKIDECTYRILNRYPMIDRMELVYLDTFKPKPLQAVRTGTPQMLGSTIGDPTVGPGAHEPALRGHHQPCGIRMERLGDQSFR